VLPFTAEQFLAVFRAYNEAAWHAQWGLLVLALAAVAMLAKPARWSSQAISAVLGGALLLVRAEAPTR
jgi:hypothetical protein